MRNWGRVLTAMVTPFNEHNEVDYEQAGVLARYLVDNGSDGLVVAGTTGESPTLSAQEKQRLFAVVKDTVGDRAAVIAGTGCNNTAETIKLTQAAERSGVDGTMLVVPYYNKPSQEGLYKHFSTVAESTNLPVILYNVPGRTSSNLLPATVQRLAQLENIIAIKEASGSTDQVTELKRLLPSDFAVYSGDDSMTLAWLALGCTGIISVAAHVVGREMQQMITAFFNGRFEEATQIHCQLYPVFKGMFLTSNPVPVKTACNMVGLKVGSVRLPLVEATESEMAQIRCLLRDVGRI